MHSHRLVLLASLLVGCGTDPTGPYVGTWSYYRSTVTTRCDGQPDVTKDLVGNIVLTRAGDAQLAIDTASQYSLAVAVSGACTPKFSVGETEAVLVPQEPCILETANATEITLTYLDYLLAPSNVTGPDIAPMTPGLSVTLEADLSSTNGHCTVSSDATVIAAAR